MALSVHAVDYEKIKMGRDGRTLLMEIYSGKKKRKEITHYLGRKP